MAVPIPCDGCDRDTPLHDLIDCDGAMLCSACRIREGYEDMNPEPAPVIDGKKVRNEAVKTEDK